MRSRERVLQSLEKVYRLFATLNPTSRRLRFPRDIEVLITDTVGFIRDLPPDLIAAFPNMGMSPAEMSKFEQLRDVGEAQRAYSRLVSEILAAE